MAFLLKNSLKLILNKQLLKVYCQQGQQLKKQGLKTTCYHLDQPNPGPDAKSGSALNAEKKLKESLKITLIQNESLSVVSLLEAEHLAKRRSMHLVKVEDLDPKSQRPVYKILTTTEMLQAELAELKKSQKKSDKAGAEKKTEKYLKIGSRIEEHDLSSRLKNINKWLKKQHEVRILIQGSSESDMGNCEKVFKSIEEAVKKSEDIGKIVQKRVKGSVMRFSILPVANDNKPSNNSQ